MVQICLEIAPVSRCDVNQCGYNTNNSCHAKAITIGDSTTPGCDTFMDIKRHSQRLKRISGVGACKTNTCQFNNDFECIAENVTVGYSNGDIRCLTFCSR